MTTTPHVLYVDVDDLDIYLAEHTELRGELVPVAIEQYNTLTGDEELILTEAAERHLLRHAAVAYWNVRRQALDGVRRLRERNRFIGGAVTVDDLDTIGRMGEVAERAVAAVTAERLAVLR
jgi:hypothetical protein